MKAILGLILVFLFAGTVAAQTIISTDPPFVVVGGGAFTLTVTGGGFDNTSTLLWNGSARATTYISSGRLTAMILAADISKQVAVGLSVTETGGTSRQFAFQIFGPLARVDSVSPNYFYKNQNATIYVSGLNFLLGSIVLFDFNPLATTYVSSQRLTAVLPGALVGHSGTHHIAVRNPAYPTPIVDLIFRPAINFGSVTQGSPSSSIIEIATNVGSSNVTFSSIPTISGTNASDFSFGTNTCTTGSPLIAGQSCTTEVIFTPSVTGTESASLVYADNASGSPQMVAMSGTVVALAPVIAFSPTALSFGSEPNGSTTSPLTETVSNNGTANLTFSITPALSGPNAADFSISSHTCATGSPVVPTSNCTTAVTFTPSTNGSESAVLTYTDNADGSPHTVALTGTGVTLSPSVQLSSATVGFGNIVTGSSSAPVVVTLTNNGGASLTISSIVIGGADTADFSQTNSCGGTLAALANCTISPVFSPLSAASFTANVTITDSASGSPHLITLSGTGVASGAPIVSLNPMTTLPFGNVHQNTSLIASESVQNTGTANLVFSTTPAISGTNASDFVVSYETCTTASPVPPAGTCTTPVNFTPSTTSSESATLTYNDNASGSPHTVSLTGTGTPPATHSTTLTWTASSSSNIIGYKVYRSTASGPFTSLTTTPISALTYNDPTVVGGTTYNYVVTAVGSSPPYAIGQTESGYSNQVTAVIP